MNLLAKILRRLPLNNYARRRLYLTIAGWLGVLRRWTHGGGQ
jgi:hypothetical protein